jgi:hypothetical protein
MQFEASVVACVRSSARSTTCASRAEAHRTPQVPRRRRDGDHCDLHAAGAASGLALDLPPMKVSILDDYVDTLRTLLEA